MAEHLDPVTLDVEAGGTIATAKGETRTLVLACGALAREILYLMGGGNKVGGLELQCLPAKLHNRPDQIPGRLRDAIHDAKARGVERILIGYADCGTGGLLDKLIEEEGVERIGGPHCYSFFTGAPDFDAMMEEEPGSFFLTDYMVRQFDHLIIEGMGLDKHPELLEMMFANYKRVVYLAQVEDAALEEKAKAAAARLGLDYHYRFTGYGELADFIRGAQENPNED